ncbi:hypothetical protein [Mucilaginibacter sp. OK098]|uniref:hypothetical protein n=1 Tax=Mucilaginibacter sp. OK098 TaxID=1855297 RepID=UPI00091AC239|nr:hypothetical protein [Mucilaginibacter sp. OK098]SHN35292.1 hypothetical protein SAMN05216524_11215 [Mucilaginibacter sp. OK098]
MQKIVTVTSRYDIINQGEDFKESEYPKLKEYLEDGYVIAQIVPVIKPADTAYRYAVIFLLTK